VLAHLHGIETTYCATDKLHLFEHGTLGVDLFFVISGVVIASVTAGKFRRPGTAGVFLYHRLARIFPIFWIYTTITLIARHFQPLRDVGLPDRSVNLVASYLLIPTHRSMLLLQGWTLSYELYFYFVFFLLLLLIPERLAPWALALWGVAVVALKLYIGLSPFPIANLLISPAVFEFLAGCILFHICRRSRLHPSVGVLLLISSILWLTAIIVYIAQTQPGHPEWIVDGPWRRPLLYGSFATLFLLGAMELERTRIIRYLPIFSSIGDWSYSIYLSHALVITLIGRVAFRLLPHHVSILLIALIALPSVILVGYFSYTFLERPLLRLLYQSAPTPKSTAGEPA